MDSAMFNQLPDSGVYKGKMPCSHSHSINSGVLCPVKLSHTNKRRNGGNASGKPEFDNE